MSLVPPRPLALDPVASAPASGRAWEPEFGARPAPVGLAPALEPLPDSTFQLIENVASTSKRAPSSPGKAPARNSSLTWPASRPRRVTGARGRPWGSVGRTRTQSVPVDGTTGAGRTLSFGIGRRPGDDFLPFFPGVPRDSGLPTARRSRSVRARLHPPREPRSGGARNPPERDFPLAAPRLRAPLGKSRRRVSPLLPNAARAAPRSRSGPRSCVAGQVARRGRLSSRPARPPAWPTASPCRGRRR